MPCCEILLAACNRSVILNREVAVGALEYTRTVEPLTYWTVVMLVGDEKVVSAMNAGCAAAACTGEISWAGHGVLQSVRQIVADTSSRGLA